jgi:hypothetical protein
MPDIWAPKIHGIGNFFWRGIKWGRECVLSPSLIVKSINFFPVLRDHLRANLAKFPDLTKKSPILAGEVKSMYVEQVLRWAMEN